ncbi:MAG: hypothetical protein Q4A65_01365 [Bacillota bacterium]|nr:hypothetical protein [Bacillota bacterium]
MSLPTDSFAAYEYEYNYGYGDSNSTQYEYYDENGQLIEDEDSRSFAPQVYPDVSWFDYTKPKKKYEITNEAQLLGLASLVNEQQAMWKTNRYETFEGVTFNLMNDIKLIEPWVPIGYDDHVTFKGVFNGNGHTISNVNTEVTGGYAGFFGYLSGTVKGLNLQGTVTASGSECGALAGHLVYGARVRDCTADVSVTAGAKTGGIVGCNQGGVIRGCINKGKVKGTVKVGGIVGENRGSVICCGNRGNVRSTSRGMTTFGTGGVAGRSVSEGARIDRCYNTGKVTSATEGTGGIAGYSNTEGSLITNSYNIGTIVVKNPKAISGIVSPKGYAGGVVGIVGLKGVYIRNCYNAGDILNSQITGGVIGKYDNVSKIREDKYIENNYFTNQNVKYGVGLDTSGGSRNISRGTIVISAGSLISGSANIGPFYINDSSATYGNNSYPVLKWQQPLPESEKHYMSCIPVTVQKELNQYILDHNQENAKGDSVMMFFNHYEFTSKAMGEYTDAK